MCVKYLLLINYNIYKQKDITFRIKHLISKIDKNCLCEITRQSDETFGMRVKQAIRKKAPSILLCLTLVKHSCQMRLIHGNIAKMNDYV